MARSARLTDIDPMPGRHLLTFELSEQGDELSIHGDAAGLRSVSYTHLTLPTILLV